LRFRTGDAMTRKASARITGFTFLLYIAAGIASMVLASQATAGDTVSSQLANVARHVLQLRLTILLGLTQNACALFLAIFLYSLTRDVDRDLALLGMAFRLGEGLTGALANRTTAQILWLSSSGAGSGTSPATVEALGTYLLKAPGANISAIFFAMGSTVFSYLLLRGRVIPFALGWLGVVASVLLLVALPLEYVGFLSGKIAAPVWIPMALYEIPLGFWLIVRGATPATAQQALVTP
jgi:hypothetical protein